MLSFKHLSAGGSIAGSRLMPNTRPSDSQEQTPVSRPHFHRNALFALTLFAASLGGCVQHEGGPTQVVAIPSGSFTPKWLADIGLEHDEVTQAFVRDELLIVYTRERFAYIFDRETGIRKFVVQLSTGGVAARAPVVLKDYVVFPTISTMEVYNRQGKEHRSVQTPGMALRSGAAGFGTRVYFGSDDPNGGRVVMLDLAGSIYQNASIPQTLHTSSGISSTPAISQGFLYAGDDSGAVYAVNAVSFAPVWPLHHEGRETNVFDAGYGIRADLKADEYGVYVPSLDTKLYCIGRADGRVRWTYFAGVPLSRSPSVTATTVYQYIENRGMVAIDKTVGDPARKSKWIHPKAIQFLAEDEKYAYLERDDHRMIAVDKATGEEKFQSQRDDFVAFGTSLKNNVIYATTADGHIRAITPVLKAGTLGEMVMVPTGELVVAAR